MHAPQRAGDGSHWYAAARGPCSSAPPCWRCSMHSPRTLSKIAAVTLVSVAILGTACERPSPLSPPPLAGLSLDAAAAGAPYNVGGAWAQAALTHAGRLRNPHRH